MKYVFFILSVIIFSSCNKKTLKTHKDYTAFIGMWRNNPGPNEDIISVNFQNNGKIIIKRSVERTITFIPTNSSHKLSDYYATNGVFWDYFTFKDSHEDYGFYMNPSKDTITFPWTIISDFFYENYSISETYLTKQ